MAECTVNSDASPQFKALREHWERNGYPHIAGDLADAFKAISQNILANKANRVQAGPVVEVYKYRHNSKDIRRGSRYGWRIIALFHKPTGIMYPIIVYPKTVWEDAGADIVAAAINEIRQILGHCISPGCDGIMANSAQQEMEGHESHIKMQCQKCGAVQWAAV